MADPLVASFLGAWLVVTFAEVALLGVNWQQLLIYQKVSAPSDRLFLRFLVFGIFLITGVHTGCFIRTCWYYAISSFGNAAAFDSTTWSFSIDPALTSVVALLVQLHYACKIWTMSERKARLSPLCIIFFSLFQMGWASWCTWAMFTLRRWSLPMTKRGPIACYLAGMAAADFLIAISFTHYMRKARGSFTETDRLLDRIVGLTVANNALTAVVAITAAILFGTGREGWQMGGLAARLYCLSFYSALNSRTAFRQELEDASLQRQNHLSPILISSATLAAGANAASTPFPSLKDENGAAALPPLSTRSKSSLTVAEQRV